MALVRNILVLLAVFAASSPAFAAEPPPDVKRTLSRSINRLGVQTEFPREKRRMIEGGSRPFAIPTEVATGILIAAIVIFLGILLLSWHGNARGSRLARDGIDDDPTGEKAAAVQTRMAAVRLEADELAGQGRYAEAMHVLLLQSVGEMRLRLRVPISVALTSREILDRIALEPEAHDALSDIIGRVEISYFGTHEPGRDEYSLCRASYSTLVALLGGAAP